MKLTKPLKQEFLEAVRRDIPLVDYQGQREEVAVEDAVSQLPPKVRELWKNAELRPFLQTRYISIAHNYGGSYFSVPAGHEIEFSTAALLKMKHLATKRDAQYEKVEKAMSELRVIVESCTTTQHMEQRLHKDFWKYIPESPVPKLMNLPSSTLLRSSLKQLGWPAPAEAA